MGQFVLNKYYSGANKVPAYSAAILLNLLSRRAYLNTFQKPTQVNCAIKAAGKIQDKESNTQLPTDAPLIQDSPAKEEIETAKLNSFAKYKAKQRPEYASPRAVDDFYCFIDIDPINLNSVKLTLLEWWCQSTQRRSYPRLSQIAITILSIPAASAEPKRVFSGAQRTCSQSRLRLIPRNIKIIKCIGNWLKKGHIKLVRASGIGFPITLDTCLNEDTARELD